MHFGKSYAFHEGKRLFKFLVTLPRKSYHHICRNWRIVKHFSDIPHYLRILRTCIVPVHSFQRFITTALQWQMKLRTKIFIFCKLFQRFHIHAFGFKWTQSYSYICTFTSRFDCVCKLQSVVTSEWWKIYPYYHNFFIAVFGKCLHFSFYIFQRTWTHSAPCIRDYAVWTKPVAPVLYFQKRPCPVYKIIYFQAFIFIFFSIVLNSGHFMLFGKISFQCRYQIRSPLVSKNYVNFGQFLAWFGKSLCHAPRQHYHCIGIFTSYSMYQLNGFLFTHLRHGTWIYDRYICFFILPCDFISAFAKGFIHRLTFKLIYLTAQSYHFCFHHIPFPFSE